MKAIRIFFRSIRDGFKSISRNFSLAMASILCVTITLIIMSVAVVIAANINYATKTIEEEMHILVYLQKEATEDDRLNLEAEINSIEKVREIDFISKEEQKTQMIESDPTFETVLNYLDENPLLDVFIVYVDDVKEISEISKQITDLPNVEASKFGEDTVEEVVTAFDIVQKIIIGILIALLLVTIFLISNTIKLTIYSRRHEIEIMRLVGASNGAIRLPFIVEGLLIGLIGAVIPVCITIYGYVILWNALNGELFTEMLLLVKPYNFVFYVSAGLVVIGALVGMYGSARSVRKYLKI